ncbi:GNAT family N-acetyltransferase [Pseudomonas sp. nanlin1]|uniref:GNAT family N-acetyltransferase n=1 Tax=Pseudomonas sp. nanlin1 TaxID=3040605 RepID=UPI00388FE149
MFQIDWLDRHMVHCNLMAEWVYQAFPYEYAEQTLASWQQVFADGQHDGQWKCLIAMAQGQLLGGATLARSDLESRPELGPWLACVYVTPAARRRGIAARLIEGICEQAQATGSPTLYLHTYDQRDYYRTLGWQVVEPFEAWGRVHWLMSRSLNADYQRP